ncbi:MAG: YggS family pyridoxal phosphate-dependent enzyme, partial [Xanthomonadaceae bacterium]|nr:YggS family pyridoxal phosphate-dependent enzyme [Xanthomonadaceae bacterium]
GLMAIPPYMVDPEESRCYYKQLRELRDDSIDRGLVDPEVFCHLSMGMSHDYPVAVEEGATYVRVGTAIFGPRRQRV